MFYYSYVVFVCLDIADVVQILFFSHVLPKVVMFAREVVESVLLISCKL